MAACNDLVLWCPSRKLQREYYICNPCTKQWAAIPPPTQCSLDVSVGFICEPYYYYKKDANNDRHHSNVVRLNVDYKYAIVRILTPKKQITSKLKVEIFSSVTGNWSKLKLSCARNFGFDSWPAEDPGVAYKGKLYWLYTSGPSNVLISLDPFSNNINEIDVIDVPDREVGIRRIYVTQRGRMRLFIPHFLENDYRWKHLSIWELNDDDDDEVDNRVGKWCHMHTLSMSNMVTNTYMTSMIRKACFDAWPIAFDPSNDDILYLQCYYNNDHRLIIACDLRAKTLEKINLIDRAFNYVSTIKYMVPWWPTPVPKINYNFTQDTDEKAHRESCDVCLEYKEHLSCT